MVVKNVPANATAVGIPARILEEEKVNQDNVTKNISFTAYAVIDDNDKFNHEAMSKAVQTLLEHSAEQDAKLADMALQLKVLSNDEASDTKVATAFDVKQPSKSKTAKSK